MYNTTASAITTPTPKPTSIPSRTTPSHAANQTTFKKKINNYDSIKSMFYTRKVLVPTNIEWRRYSKMVPKWSHSSPFGVKHNLDSSHVERGNLSQDELYFDCGMWSVKHLLAAWYSDTQHHNGSHSANGCLDFQGKSIPSKIPNEVSISSGSHNAIAGGKWGGGALSWGCWPQIEVMTIMRGDNILQGLLTPSGPCVNSHCLKLTPNGPKWFRLGLAHC